MSSTLSDESLKDLLVIQKGEITGYHVYLNLSKRIKNKHNQDVLKTMALEEKSHYDTFKTYTNQDVKAGRFQMWFFTFISRLFGLTFGIKLLENQEDHNAKLYRKLEHEIPEISGIIADEEEHEQLLINMINEEGLNYMSSVVLGLNDALVELTGALAGFTLSLQNSKTIALLGLITGISASLSMAASEYLSTKADEADGESGGKNPLKASIYTGIAYVFTVIFLILPFLILNNYIVSLGVTIGIAITIIAIFNYYISVAKGYNFKSRFFGMASVSLGVAFISFVIGYIVKTFIGIDL